MYRSSYYGLILHLQEYKVSPLIVRIRYYRQSLVGKMTTFDL